MLVDVWEYTCINWIRTSPYVKAWNRDYAALGLVVVGVHAPEFEFGKRAENIDRGIRDHGLTYPIAIDNDFAIWRALGNDAWPAKYLFDGQGRLVKRWVGEGRYDEIEAEIRRLLVAAKPGIQLPLDQPRGDGVCEDRCSPPTPGSPTRPTSAPSAGSRARSPWKAIGDSGRQYVELRKGTGKIVLPFTAGEVNLVMQPGPRGMRRSPCCSTGSRSATPAEQTSAQTEWRASIGPACFAWSPARRDDGTC